VPPFEYASVPSIVITLHSTARVSRAIRIARRSCITQFDAIEILESMANCCWVFCRDIYRHN